MLGFVKFLTAGQRVDLHFAGVFQRIKEIKRFWHGGGAREKPMVMHYHDVLIVQVPTDSFALIVIPYSDIVFMISDVGHDLVGLLCKGQ